MSRSARRVLGVALAVAALSCTTELSTTGADAAAPERDASAPARSGADASTAVDPDAASGVWHDATLGAEDAAPQASVDAGSDGPLRVAVISDLNGSYGSTTYIDSVHAAVDRLLELSPDLVLSTGDMVAGQRAGLDYEGMWAGFHAAVSDRLAEAAIPFAPTPGNHDASGYAAYAEERAIFVEQWRPRRPQVQMVDGSDYPLRYSFTAGSALFVSLDSTQVGPLSAEQMEWLDRQLAAAEQPVKIVYGHVPLYPFAEGRASDRIGDRELEDMLVRRGVDLFVSGHHHAYYPGRRGSLRLVSTACVGAGPRALLGTTSRSERSILLFEVHPDGIVDLDAYAGATYDRRIERSTLPRYVGSGSERVDRDDL